MGLPFKLPTPPPIFSDDRVPFVYQDWFRQIWLATAQNWSVFTPVFTGATIVGTPTYVGRFRVRGHSCEFQVSMVSSTTWASVAGTTYMDVPVDIKSNAGLAGVITVTNKTTNIAVGVGHVDYTNGRIYLPAQAATGNTLVMAGSYEI